MHCEKNLCENMLKTVLGAKDSYGSREDMQEDGIRRDLWLAPSENGRDLYHMPKAPYILTASGQTTVLDIIKNFENTFQLHGCYSKVCGGWET